MNRKFKIALVGLEHDHIWSVAEGFFADERAEVVAVADKHPALLEAATAKWSGLRVFSDYAEMLNSVQLDAVLVYTDNASGANVVEAAAARGVHALVEKPMAATLTQADRMLIAAQNASTTLMVNWPTAWSPAFVEALRLAESGALGQVFKVRYRAAHEGPKELGCSPFFYEWLYDKQRNGAGALMDYCCYGANYAAYLLGRPNAVAAVAGRMVKDTIPVEDNAVILAKYNNGIGICEASWTTHGFGYELMINGTTATVKSDGETLQLSDGKKVQEISAPALPDNAKNAAAYFLTCLAEGRPVEGLCNAVVARNAQEILEAGVIAAETGNTVPLPVVSRR